jgi:hypothetical protein
MKTKLFSGLMATLAGVTTLVSLNAPANASGFKSLYDSGTFDPFITQEREDLRDIANANIFEIDPEKLTLSTDHEVKIHFLKEGAWWRNQLEYSVTDAQGNISEGIAFEDISSATATQGWLSDADGALVDGESEYSLGTVAKGSKLDFNLLVRDWAHTKEQLDAENGKSQGKWYTVSSDASANSDGLSHVAAYYLDGFVVLGFEDEVGGDYDYNDTLMVLDIGKENADNLISTPEPATTTALLGVAAAGMFSLRRRKNNSVKS